VPDCVFVKLDVTVDVCVRSRVDVAELVGVPVVEGVLVDV